MVGSFPLSLKKLKKLKQHPGTCVLQLVFQVEFLALKIQIFLTFFLFSFAPYNFTFYGSTNHFRHCQPKRTQIEKRRRLPFGHVDRWRHDGTLLNSWFTLVCGRNSSLLRSRRFAKNGDRNQCTW